MIRVQNYERMEMRRIYIENYNLAVFAMLKNLAELIMETVMESSVDLAGRFMVVGGKYMDKAAVLYERISHGCGRINGNCRCRKKENCIYVRNFHA